VPRVLEKAIEAVVKQVVRPRHRLHAAQAQGGGEDQADLAQAGEYAPEQLRFLGARAAVDVAVHRHHLQRLDVVRLGAVPEGRHADTGDGERAAHGHRKVVGEDRGHEALPVRTGHHVAPDGARLDGDRPCFLVQGQDAVHGLHVQQHPSLADGELRLRMGGPAGGDGEAVAPCEEQSLPHVLDGRRLHHQLRSPLMDVPEVGQELVMRLGAVEHDALDRGP
jgi:hypothetical protein